MEWDLNDIQNVRVMNMVGFSGETSQVIGKVTLLVKTHGMTIYSKMMAINTNSTYNVILGRPWLHNMKVLPSTYHQMIKFSVDGKIEKIRVTKYMPIHAMSQL